MNRKAIIIVAAVIAVIIISVGLLAILNPSVLQNPTVTPTPTPSPTPSPTPTPTPQVVGVMVITGLNAHVLYPNPTDDFFGPASISGMESAPLMGKTCDPYYKPLTFKNLDENTSHTVNNITVTTEGCTLKSVTPTLPVTLAPGESVIVTLTIITPSFSYSGAISIDISVS